VERQLGPVCLGFVLISHLVEPLSRESRGRQLCETRMLYIAADSRVRSA
jgi:hypothetical protein